MPDIAKEKRAPFSPLRKWWSFILGWTMLPVTVAALALYDWLLADTGRLALPFALWLVRHFWAVFFLVPAVAFVTFLAFLDLPVTRQLTQPEFMSRAITPLLLGICACALMILGPALSGFSIDDELEANDHRYILASHFQFSSVGPVTDVLLFECGAWLLGQCDLLYTEPFETSYRSSGFPQYSLALDEAQQAMQVLYQGRAVITHPLPSDPAD